MKHEEKASRIFAAHSGQNKLFFTSDGHPFFEANSATNHARTLEDKHVETVERHEVKVAAAAKPKAENKPAAKPAAPAKPAAAPKPAAPAKAAAKPKAGKTVQAPAEQPVENESKADAGAANPGTEV